MLQDVYTLLCKRDLHMALITLPKIINFLTSDQRLFVVDDGSFTEELVIKIQQISSKITIITKKDREDIVLELLGNRPNCIKYRRDFPLAFKLIDIPLIASKKQGRYTFTDSDIIYIKNCGDYFQKSTNTYLRTDAIKLSIKLKNGIFKYQWRIPYKFNSGYFSYDTTDFDLDFIEYYLGLPDIHNIPWLSEQTCWALLFGKSGESYCPKENEFVCKESFGGPTSDTLAIHLIGKLKNKVSEWSNNVITKSDSLFSPTFERSRNITVLDWLKKSAGRFVQ